jgi:hypothetical protein
MSMRRLRLVSPVLAWSLLLFCLLAAVAGCGHDPVVAPEVTSRDVWIGVYAAGPGLEHGVIAMDVSRAGADLTGRLVLRSRASTAPYVQLFVRGTARGDSLLLKPDPALNPGLQGFGIRAERNGSHLSGALTYTAYAIQASLDCSAFAVDAIAAPKVFALPDTTVIGLTSVGTELWTGTPDFDYVVFDTTGVRERRVPVLYYPDAHWVSDALTSDGTRLWGQYPVSMAGGTPRDQSVLVEFTPSGVITARRDVTHRIIGLAHDGTALWSLPLGGDHLYRLDTASGAVLDSVEVAVPDLTKFASDGERFWAVGWFLNLLYEIDRQGRVVRIFDQPSAGRGDGPVGLTFVGADLWLARTNVTDSWLYRMLVAP